MLLIAALIALSGLAPADPPEFKKHVLTTEFISEGVAVADVNRDGRMDVLAGAYWFEAPAWTRHELRPAKTFDLNTGYSDTFLNFALDVNLDGWADLIRVDFPGLGAYWYENPKGAPGHWRERLIHGTVANESPRIVDVDRDGRLDLLAPDYNRRQMAWFRAPTDARDTTLAWTRYPISEPQAAGTDRFSHGLGFGDLNEDGRSDVVVREGWYEQPASPYAPDWTFHPAALGEAAAQMYVLDVDGDGDQDVVSSSAHDYGMWWHEQGREGGAATWQEHGIYDKVSQTHSLSQVDLNANGMPDFVTGKRFWAHMGNDPGERETPILMWFELSRGADGQPVWTRHVIDEDSGAGLNTVTEDVTGDDLVDIVVANKKGVFVFEQL